MLIIPTPNGDHVLEIDGGEGQWNAPFTIDNCEVISDVLEQAHFRADAVGYISLFGNVNVEGDAGTAVVVSNGVEINQSLFDWTYYKLTN